MFTLVSEGIWVLRGFWMAQNTFCPSLWNVCVIRQVKVGILSGCFLLIWSGVVFCLLMVNLVGWWIDQRLPSKWSSEKDLM